MPSPRQRPGQAGPPGWDPFLGMPPVQPDAMALSKVSKEQRDSDSHGASVGPWPGCESQGVGGRGRWGDACSCTVCLESQQVTKAPPLDCLLYGYSYYSFFFFFNF